MKESKFIELLNLYVDGQLDPTEALSLETEIQRDPARRRIYGEYCRMQKACTILALNYLAEGAPEQDAKVIAMPSQSRVWTPVFYATGLAAAACMAFIVVTRVNRSSKPMLATPGNQTAPATAPMATVAMPEHAAPRLVSVGTVGNFDVRKTEVAAMLIPTGLKLSQNYPSQQVLLSANDGTQFAWMNSVKLAPLNASVQPVFESRALQEDNPRVFRSPVITPVDINMIGFQFQK